MEMANGYLSYEEINAVTEIDVSNMGISSLQGIELFTNLKKLKCSGNNLTALDLTQLKNLTYLDCSDNQLTELDITQCPNLQTLKTLSLYLMYPITQDFQICIAIKILKLRKIMYLKHSYGREYTQESK